MWSGASAGEAGGAGQPACGCGCAGVDAAAAVRAARDNRLTTLDDLLACLGAVAACRACRELLAAILARVDAALLAEGLLLPEELAPPPLPAPAAQARLVSLGSRRPGARAPADPPERSTERAAASSRLSHPEKLALIEETLASLRPRLQADGGDCELYGLEEDRVLVRLAGRCVGCQQASVTTEGIQQRLIERLGQFVRVVPVAPGSRTGG